MKNARLSRRRSRVRVPSLPSLEVPAKRHLVLPQQADVARLGQQTGSTFGLSQVRNACKSARANARLGCASEQLRDSVRSGNMTSGVLMASVEHRALSADTPAIFLRARADSSTRRGCRSRGRVAPSAVGIGVRIEGFHLLVRTGHGVSHAASRVGAIDSPHRSASRSGAENDGGGEVVSRNDQGRGFRPLVACLLDHEPREAKAARFEGFAYLPRSQ